jgi:hypothetical protein
MYDLYAENCKLIQKNQILDKLIEKLTMFMD